MRGLRATPRGITTAVLAVVLVGAGLLLGDATMRALGGFAAGVVAVAAVPALVRVRPTVTRTVSPVRVERGEHAVATLVVANEGSGRQPSFTAIERVDGELREIPVAALAPGAQSEHRYDVPTGRRGRVDLGPVTVQRADPLGLARSRSDSEHVDHLWVQPRRHHVLVGGAGRLRHHHEGVVPDRPLRGSTDVRNLRDYLPGDELRHVHWRATARTGRLVVREYVDPVQPHCTVVLDTGTAESADVFEEAVEVAASVVWSAVLRGHRVTLRTADGERLQCGGRPEGVQPLLDRLAAVRQDGRADLVGVLDAAARSGDGGWLVVAGGAAAPPVLARLVGMHGYGTVTVFDVSGWPDHVEPPGVTVVRATTARAAVETWNARP